MIDSASRLPPPASRVFSFEFFPPKTAEATQKLRETRRQLAQLNPHFFSVTYGAGGSTRDRTLEAVMEIQAEGHPAAPHLAGIASTREQIREILQRYHANGIRHIVALRGDLPSGEVDVGDFRYASELVRFIRAETGDHFTIEVAAYPEYHPEALSPRDDLLSLKRKIDAGANSAITQYFYNPEAYFSFVEEVQAIGIDVPIVPGIMPISNYAQLARFSDTCGAEIPRWIRLKLQSYGHDIPSIRAFGLEVVTDLCDKLLSQGAPGLHFYTLNQAALTATIWQRLGL